MSSEAPSGVAGWALSVMDAAGAPGAAAVIGLENVFPPIPSEVVLPLAGFAAGQGRFGVLSAILWTTAGSVLGALVLYALGRWLGLDRLRAAADRIPLTCAADVDRACAAFDRHGSGYVLFGRMVPLVRSLVSIPAGVAKMPLPRFVLLTAVGSGVWNTAFVLAGYGLGSQWHRVEPYAGTASTVVLVALVVAMLVVIARRMTRSRSWLSSSR